MPQPNSEESMTAWIEILIAIISPSMQGSNACDLEVRNLAKQR